MIISKNSYDKCNRMVPLFMHKLNRIGVLLDRTNSLILWIKALFDLNITIVPIDSSLPKERVCHIIEDANIDLLITQKKYQGYYQNYKNYFIDCENNSKSDFVGNNPISKDNSIAYILYTSGSTGQPKGVEVTREALMNFIDSASEIIDFSPEKRIACLASVSFDIFFVESVMAMYKGLTIILANEEEQRNPKLMAKLIQDNNVDMIITTPSRVQLLLNHDKEISCLKNVKEFMIGGEPFPLNLLRILQEKTQAKIYNMYGPTETTICSTISDLTHKDNINIGRPIKNTEIYIVDENLSVLSDGQVGEICIAGKGLAKGYAGRKDLTAEKFIFPPQKPDIRVYRTGDLGRYLSNGDLEFIGRTDNQVKIRGHRIELEEIESQLNRFENIEQSIVIATKISDVEIILEAYYTSKTNINYYNIIEYLSSRLPSYMVPAVLKHVNSFIYTTSGKIDRNRITECIEVLVESKEYESFTLKEMSDIQKKSLEAIISNIDAKFLNNISLETEFSSIGLDSITFIKIVVALEGEFSFEFDDEMLLITAFSTIKSMVEYVESKITTL